MYFVLFRQSGNTKTFHFRMWGPQRHPKRQLILECEALKDNWENYAGIMAASSWDNLFSEDFVEKVGAVIVKLHRKRVEYKSEMEEQSVP
jgi:hypothetical protein